ncbi:fanconi anemia group J protein, partial [Tanacetum coccineum]
MSSSKTNIGGILIEFPFQPYGSQLSFMSRVIATLDRAQRDGHFPALLESPTGTRKTLSLLCSVIAGQKNHKAKYGGNMMPTLSDTNNKTLKMKRGPVIYYATRTHSQISQVIGEFRKTNYHVPMAVLDRKNILCREFLNAPMIRAHPSVREGGCYEVHETEDLVKLGEMVQGCSDFGAQAKAEVADIVFCPYNYILLSKLLIKVSDRKNIRCKEFLNAPMIRAHPSVRKGGCYEVHDIEDLVKVGEMVLIFWSTMHGRMADKVFCPYNYIINPQIRKAMEISVEGNIIILDEAHWTAEKALRELEEASISKQCFPSLQECATQAIRIAADADPDIDHLSGMASTVFFLRLPTFSLETGNTYVIISLPCNVRPPKVKL